ncbi:hypothetical protein CWC46_04005 [Prodigiosinella confusarubida]|uniref:YgjV family protein n=1 Tax=Serratia sp. (strain ATCC 39006) TaxID=104623 RepID=A0A2I5T3B8_SERS3|nr:hypothetical protein CWC46_04005 [Serratia sp. ATCC 39006]AUH03368.1 hypothetical protein Ser39006_004005 [Serratia sp. ATCC 39006]
MSFLDVFGYIGTVVVALSFICKSILRLRLLNMIGATIITLYALTIRAYPVAVLDGLIVIINGYQLYLIYKSKKGIRINAL